jgi:hypothetical protein
MKRLHTYAFLIVASLAATDCTTSAVCKPGTIFVNISLDSAAAQATTLAGRVMWNGAGPFNAAVGHQPGAAQGIVQIDAPAPYVAGQSVTVEILAETNGLVVGTATTGPRELPAGCASFSLTIVSAVPDMALPDSSGPRCTSSAICAGYPSQPICKAMVCRPCTSSADDAECAAAYHDRPKCDVPSGMCVASSQCTDGIKDGAETDVDCGGPVCMRCAVGQLCNTNSDCASAVCNAMTHICAASQCSDGIKDGAETDVDCGGPVCVRCSVGQLCNTGSDCASALCNATTHTCVASQCSDGVEDGAETDVDCGGPVCMRCSVGQRCNTGSDCASTLCNAITHTCAVSQCSDGVKDGAETDVDCGGPVCMRCSVGQRCNTGSDCTSTLCNASTHTCVASQCEDGMRDGMETDVDCGGPVCSPCSLSKTCKTGTDCVSGVCNVPQQICVASQCEDGVRDNTETDIDCGGATCPRCALGHTCYIDADCTSNVCDPMTRVCVTS